MRDNQTEATARERRNYYRILNVQPDAPVEIIRNNYRTLLQKLRLHPDLGGVTQQASIITPLPTPAGSATVSNRLSAIACSTLA